MFNKGDTVVHPSYGAGVVVGTAVIERDGEEKQYLSIELNDDHRGRLLVPMGRVETSGLRKAMTDFSMVEEIMLSLPEELPENHRSRQNQLETTIKDGIPRQLMRTLRDLCWREWTGKLTTTDSRLRNRILKRLIMELAVGPSMTTNTARQRIDSIIETARVQHEATLKTHTAQA